MHDIHAARDMYDADPMSADFCGVRIEKRHKSETKTSRRTDVRQMDEQLQKVMRAGGCMHRCSACGFGASVRKRRTRTHLALPRIQTYKNATGRRRNSMHACMHAHLCARCTDYLERSSTLAEIRLPAKAHAYVSEIDKYLMQKAHA